MVLTHETVKIYWQYLLPRDKNAPVCDFIRPYSRFRLRQMRWSEHILHRQR